MTRDALVDACVPLAAELVGAACAGVREPLWDGYVEGENEVERISRQARGLEFCRRCPQRLACASSVDIRHDDGIRGGVVLPTIHDGDRRASSSFLPGRGGLAPVLARRETSPPTCETSEAATLAEQDAAPTCANTGGPLTPAEPSRTRSQPDALTSALAMPPPGAGGGLMTSPPRNWSARPLTLAEVAPYEARFFQRVQRGTTDECWLWTGCRHPSGYGRMHIGRRGASRTLQVHRLSWVLATGRDLGVRDSIDHLCRVRNCVNPAHLEPVSIHENVRRAQAKSGSPEAVEQEVLRLLLTADPDTSARHPRGHIRRICPLCGVSYGTDYLADHIRRHILAGPKFRQARVRPRDGSALDMHTCPDCGATIKGHMRRHRARMHGAVA